MRLMITQIVVIIVLVWTLVAMLVFYPKHVQFSESHEVGGFVLIQQPDHITCGPTSTTMLLNRYGVKVTLDEVRVVTKTTWFKWNGKDVGTTSPDFIELALRKFGVPARLRASNMDNLRWYIDHDRPPIILLRSGPMMFHYVVATGYNKEFIIIADPGWGERREIPIENFKTAWNFTTDMEGEKPNLKVDICKIGERLVEIQPNMLIVPNEPVSK